jgi:hypothetical protein
MDPVRYYLGLMKFFLGKLLTIRRTAVLPLLSRCRLLFDRPASALSSLLLCKAPGKRGGGLLADRLGFAAKQSPGAMQ